MPQVTENIIRFINGRDNGGYDPIQAVKEHDAILRTVVEEYPEQSDDIIIACIDAHGLACIETVPEYFLQTDAVKRRIARYKLTTPTRYQ